MVQAFRDFFGSKKEDNPTTDGVEAVVSGPETVHTGKIIKLSADGWGFITSKEIPFTRIFFHWTSLKQETLKFPELKKGMEVQFVAITTADKGTRAIKITVVEKDDV